MQPLSARRRLVYLLTLVLVFAIALPVTLLYASGFRYKEGTGLVRIGGAFISVPYSGAVVSLNGRVVGESGFLKHDFYIGTLVPNTYTIRVESVGERSWTRTIVVEEQLVTDTQALLIKQQIGLYRLVIATSTSATSSLALATTTRLISAAEDADMRASFLKPPATTTEGAFGELRGEGVFVEHGDTLVRWLNPSEFPPSIFCTRPSACVPVIPIEHAADTTSTDAEFFGGGIVYATAEGGIYFAEADVRPGAIRIPLYLKPGIDFRIVNGRLIVKDESRFYEIQLQ
jgi:hypothetical protein